MKLFHSNVFCHLIHSITLFISYTVIKWWSVFFHFYLLICSKINVVIVTSQTGNKKKITGKQTSYGHTCVSCWNASAFYGVFSKLIQLMHFYSMPILESRILKLSFVILWIHIHMGVWQGVAMDSLKFHPSPPCPTLLCPAGEPPLRRPYSHFRGGLPAGRAACAHPTPYAYAFSVYLRHVESRLMNTEKTIIIRGLKVHNLF